MAAIPGYLIVLGHSLDGAKMAVYSAALPPIYAKFGGHYLGIGGPGRGVELLEGGWFDHSAVLARFPSVDAPHKFWFSPEYTKAKELRIGAGTFNVFAAPGTGKEAPKGQPTFLISVYRPFDPDVLRPIRANWSDRLKQRGIDLIVDAKFSDMEKLEGDLRDFDIEIAAFPTQAAATGFWNDPTTKASRDARSKVAGYNTFLMAGLPSK